MRTGSGRPAEPRAIALAAAGFSGRADMSQAKMPRVRNTNETLTTLRPDHACAHDIL